jgi:hypothetical protein
MTKMLDTLMTGLDEVEAFLAAETAGNRVNLPAPPPAAPDHTPDTEHGELVAAPQRVSQGSLDPHHH